MAPRRPCNKQCARDQLANDPERSYITPRDCFIRHVNNRVGWGPIPGTGCAHYVAHELTIAGGNRKDKRCLDKLAITTGQVARHYPEERTGTKLSILHKVRENDVWAKLNADGESGHCGYVKNVTPGRKPTIEIEHLSSSAKAVKPDTYGVGIKGGKFYGPEQTPTNWKANCNPTDPNRKYEFHKVDNAKGDCQIDEIKCVVYFKSKAEAQSYGYDPCENCMEGESTR